MRFKSAFASGLEDEMGSGLTESDVVRLVGAMSPFLMREFLRTGACVGELRRAVSIAAAARGPAGRISPRLRRLVDLISVGQSVGAGTAA